jgi:hypothetical protein
MSESFFLSFLVRVHNIRQILASQQYINFKIDRHFSKSFNPAMMDFFILGVSAAFAKGHHSAVIG